MNIEGNLSEGVKALFASSIERLSMGERIAWDLVPMMVPDHGMVFTVVFMTPGTVINTVIQAGGIVGDIANLKQENTDEFTRRMIEQLLSARSQNTQQLLTGKEAGPLMVPGSNGASRPSDS